MVELLTKPRAAACAAARNDAPGPPLRGFPQHVLGPGCRLYRIHHTSHGPWFFHDDGLFRFDLRERPGWGTCYLAETPLGAFVESLQHFRTASLPRAELAARKLYTYEVNHALVFADITATEATRFGIDASAFAGPSGNYGASQMLATHMFDGEFSGIRYRLRNDLGQQLIGVALFGPAGAQPDDLLDGEDNDIDEELLALACREAAFRTRGPLLDHI